LTTKDVGDYIVWTLTVSPSAPDTAAVLIVVPPEGATSTPGQTANADKSVWTSTPYLATMGGNYIGRWVVTNTGAGVEPDQTVNVRPTLPISTLTYATTKDYAEHFEMVPPNGLRTLLRRATRRVDEMLKTAVYDVDVNNMPTDAAVIAACKEACCEQAAWMIETGDTSGIGLVDVYTQVSILSVQLTRGPGGSGRTSSIRYAPNAVAVLQLAGLLTAGVYH
jgi:hypothetical protein